MNIVKEYFYLIFRPKLALINNYSYNDVSGWIRIVTIIFSILAFWIWKYGRGLPLSILIGIVRPVTMVEVSALLTYFILNLHKDTKVKYKEIELFIWSLHCLMSAINVICNFFHFEGLAYTLSIIFVFSIRGILLFLNFKYYWKFSYIKSIIITIFLVVLASFL